MAPLIISVEATIASGKSTLLSLVEKVLGKNVYIVQEPVAEWQAIEGNADHNLLGLFYDNMSRWSYSFQSYVFLTRVRAVENAIKKLEAEGRLDDTVILVERSYYSDKETFARLGLESGNFSATEWAMYESWWNWLVTKTPEFSGHIYMSASIETVMHRLGVRHRGEETGITRDYQASLIEKHEQWVSHQEAKGVPMLVVDAEVDFLSQPAELEAIVGQLSEFFTELRAKSAGWQERMQRTPELSVRAPLECSPELAQPQKTRSDKPQVKRSDSTLAAHRFESESLAQLKIGSGREFCEASTCVGSTDSD